MFAPSALPVKSRQRFRSGLVQSCHSAELNKDCSSILRMLQWLVESKHSEIIFIAHPKNKPATRHTSCLPPRCHSEKPRVNKTKRHSFSKKDVLLPPLPGFALKLLRCPVWPSNTVIIYAIPGNLNIEFLFVYKSSYPRNRAPPIHHLNLVKSECAC